MNKNGVDAINLSLLKPDCKRKKCGRRQGARIKDNWCGGVRYGK
jgi:hypothetical protein